MKELSNILTAIVVVVFLLGALVAIPIIAVIIAIGVAISIVFLVIQDHREYKKSQKD